MSGNPDLELRAGDTRAVLAPEVGATIVRYWSEGKAGPLHWLRPGPLGGGTPRRPGEMGCYPLVPYSNRIRNGKFRFGGREIALPLNFGDHPHSIHGQGWQSSWSAVSHTESEAALEYRHAPDAWPWEYRARMNFRLAPQRLSVTLSLENLSTSPMPAGLGFHPYYPRTPLTSLTADVEQVWLTDQEVMPVRREAPPPEWDLRKGLRVESAVMDNGFTGWKRKAVVDWPEEKRRLTLTGGDGLEFLVVYTPKGRANFCAEPVSHCTDAFNRAEAGERDTGMRVLAPGEGWTVEIGLQAEMTG